MSPAADSASTTPAAQACLAELRSLSGITDGPLERHGLRVYEIATQLAHNRGLQLDSELLLCVAWLHDAGL